VGDEVRDRFASQFGYAQELFRKVMESDPVREKYPLLFLTARAPGHSDFGPRLHLDLVAANRRQLLDAGLRRGKIWASPLCASCRTDRLFSHRKEKGVTGRMMGAVGIRNL
jgi:copper oxidase (laccase) domain-containing protein